MYTWDSDGFMWIIYFATSAEKVYGRIHQSLVCLQVIFCILFLYHIHWALWRWYNSQMYMISETQLETAYFISVRTKLSPHIHTLQCYWQYSSVFTECWFESHEDLSYSPSKKIPNMLWEQCFQFTVHNPHNVQCYTVSLINHGATYHHNCFIFIALWIKLTPPWACHTQIPYLWA